MSWFRRVYLLLEIRAASLKRPFISLLFILSPIIIGIFAVPTNAPVVKSGNALLDLMSSSYILSLGAIPVQVSLSSVILIDIIGGEKKREEDHTLLAMLPIKETDVLFADVVICILVLQLQLCLLIGTIILVCPVNKSIFMVMFAFGMLSITAIIPAFIIASIIVFVVEILSALLAFITLPFIFLFWNGILLALTNMSESTWIIFASIPITMLAGTLLVSNSIGTNMTELIYPIANADMLVLHAATVLLCMAWILLLLTVLLRSARVRFSYLLHKVPYLLWNQ